MAEHEWEAPEPWTPDRDYFDWATASPDEIDVHLAKSWYLRDGTQATSMRDIEGKLRDLAYKRIKRERLWHGGLLSTVWLGLDHSFGDGPPLIFESMLFAPGTWNECDCRRYATEAEARAGHEEMRAEWMWRPWPVWQTTLSRFWQDTKEFWKAGLAWLDKRWHYNIWFRVWDWLTRKER